MGMIGGIFLIPIFVQNYLGYSVTQSGYLFIPMAFGILISAQMGARLSARIQPGLLTAGGMLWASFMFYQFTFIDVKWTSFDIMWRLFLFACGLGIGLAPLTQAATSTIPLEEVGVASSVLALARNVSGAFGVAIFATVLSNSVNANLLAIQTHSVINTTDPTVISEIYALAATKANILAFATVFRIAIYFMVLGAGAALFVKRSKNNFNPADHHPVEMG